MNPPDFPTFKTDQLPHSASGNYSDDDDAEAEVDHRVIQDDPDAVAEGVYKDWGLFESFGHDAEEEDLFYDNYFGDYWELDEEYQFESFGPEDAVSDEPDVDQAAVSDKSDVDQTAQLGRSQDDDEDEEDRAPVIARKFREFLLKEYVGPIDKMVSAKKCSLEIDYRLFLSAHLKIASWLSTAPRSVLKVMEDVALQVVFDLHPNCRDIYQNIYVRIKNLRVERMRDIGQKHLNTMIRIEGVVTRRSRIFRQPEQVKFNCGKCGTILGPFFQSSISKVPIESCPGPECGSRGQFIVNVKQIKYRNYQKLTIQESPGIVPVGRRPTYKEVILFNELIDYAQPGEEIEVTGIYTEKFELSQKSWWHEFPDLTVVEANYIVKKQDLFSARRLTQKDKDEIEKLATDPRIGKRIVKSIAPSINGDENIKTAIALAMFGGQEKNVEGKHRRRGDINVLLVGDIKTAKSQFLKYVERTGHRAVYTTGKGASAAGLMAAVHKDPVTWDWTLEGGALVLADRGICLIDEFESMNDQDRASIHEAMKRQSISISKAGIDASLQARCSVIAAANPISGRYDSSISLAQNTELTDPVISCFDIICVAKAFAVPDAAEMLDKSVIDSRFKSHPKGSPLDDTVLLPEDLLKKYIAYAKSKVSPQLDEAGLDKLAHVNAELRRESSIGQGLPLSVRHRESIIRMSEAHARMHLRQDVTQEDVDMATRVLLDSFKLKRRDILNTTCNKINNGNTSNRVWNPTVDEVLPVLRKNNNANPVELIESS